MAWNKCPSAGSNYCQQRNQGGREKNHRGRHLGFAKPYCQDTLAKNSCFNLPAWFT